jgi:hypothetical protein
MKRQAWILGFTILIALGTGAAHADSPVYSGYAVTNCETLLWNTCATPFHVERVFPLGGGTIQIAPQCVSTAGSPVCLAAVQRQAHLVDVPVGPEPYLGAMPPGFGPGIELATAGPGGTLSIAACNNDATHCPGEITFAISVAVPGGTTLTRISQSCLVLVEVPTGTLGLCHGGFSSS